MAISMNGSSNQNPSPMRPKLCTSTQDGRADERSPSSDLHHQQQLRCYLCEIPKQEYSLTRAFSEIICRGCLNYEGPDRVESIIALARRYKTSQNKNQTQSQTTPATTDITCKSNFSCAKDGVEPPKSLTKTVDNTNNRVSNFNTPQLADRNSTIQSFSDECPPSPVDVETLERNTISENKQHIQKEGENGTRSVTRSPSPSIVWEGKSPPINRSHKRHQPDTYETNLKDEHKVKRADLTNKIVIEKHPVAVSQSQNRNYSYLDCCQLTDRSSLGACADLNQSSNKSVSCRLNPCTNDPRLTSPNNKSNKTTTDSSNQKLPSRVDSNIQAAPIKVPHSSLMNYVWQQHMIPTTATMINQIPDNLKRNSNPAATHASLDRYLDQKQHQQLQRQMQQQQQNMQQHHSTQNCEGDCGQSGCRLENTLVNDSHKSKCIDRHLQLCGHQNPDAILHKSVRERCNEANHSSMYPIVNRGCNSTAYFMRPQGSNQTTNTELHPANVRSINSSKDARPAVNANIYGSYPISMGPYITANPVFCAPQFHPYAHYPQNHPLQTSPYHTLMNSDEHAMHLKALLSQSNSTTEGDKSGLTQSNDYKQRQQSAVLNDYLANSPSHARNSAVVQNSRCSPGSVRRAGSSFTTYHVSDRPAEETKRESNPNWKGNNSNVNNNSTSGQNDKSDVDETKKDGLNCDKNLNDSTDNVCNRRNSEDLKQKNRSLLNHNTSNDCVREETSVCPSGEALECNQSKNDKFSLPNSAPSSNKKTTVTSSKTKNSLNVEANRPDTNSVNLRLLDCVTPPPLLVDKQEDASVSDQQYRAEQSLKVSNETAKHNGVKSGESNPKGSASLKIARSHKNRNQDTMSIDGSSESITRAQQSTETTAVKGHAKTHQSPPSNKAKHHNDNGLRRAESNNQMMALQGRGNSTTATNDLHKAETTNFQEFESDQQVSATRISNLLKCMICKERLEDRHFVQCPSAVSHKFCFACSKIYIEKQQLENKNLKIGKGKVFCPSGLRCQLKYEPTPWSFMNSEIETIFRESSRFTGSSISTNALEGRAHRNDKNTEPNLLAQNGNKQQRGSHRRDSSREKISRNPKSSSGSSALAKDKAHGCESSEVEKLHSSKTNDIN